jgi:drug/metabolite transporter (DMT)-like permease
MTVVFALGAALIYGLSDFIGGVASRRTSVWPVGVLACTGGLVGSVVIALVAHGDPSGTDLAWGLLAGLGGGTGTAFLYRGLAAGRMGVIAPVSGVGAALVPLVAGLIDGDRPAVIGWVGIVMAFPGIWLVSRTTSSAPTPADGSGLLDGVLAGLGFGLAFSALGQVSDGAGYWPLAGMELVSVVTMAVAALLLGGNPVPRQLGDLWGLLPGLLGTFALLCFVLANHHGLLSISAVITALYPAFTVLLAIGLLRERVHLSQAAGLALCAASVAFVSLG